MSPIEGASVNISTFDVGVGIGEDVVRIDQGNDKKNWLLLRRFRVEEFQHPLPHRRISLH